MFQSYEPLLGGPQYLGPPPKYTNQTIDKTFAQPLSQDQLQSQTLSTRTEGRLTAHTKAAVARNLELLSEFTRAIGLRVAVTDEDNDTEDIYSQIPDPE